MNIQTTATRQNFSLNIARNDTSKEAPAANENKDKAAVTPQETFTPEVDGESRASAAWRGGIHKGIAWGEALEKPLGGMSAIGLAIGSGVALSLGGAMVGGLVGGSFGSAVSALQSDGPISFLANSFGNMGTAISVGSTVGSVAGIAGGLALGSKVGGGVAKTLAFTPGFVAGAVQGAVNPSSIPAEPKEPKEPKQAQELRGVFKGAAKVGGGVGLLSGAAGGFVTGATLTAAGSLVVDVAKGDFSFGNFVGQLGTTALVGGAVGGALGATVGASGGEAVFGKGPQWVWDKTGGRLTADKPNIRERVEKREGELGERQTVLEERSETLTKESSQYREQHAATSKELDNRENKMESNEKELGKELDTLNTRIESTAQKEFAERSTQPDSAIDKGGKHSVIGERLTLAQWESKLDGWQGDLNDFRSELGGWENKLDAKIDSGASAIFSEERKPIDKHFGQLHSELDAFEGKLDKYETDINGRIQERYQSGINAEKPGLERDRDDAVREKRRSEDELRNARSEQESASSRHNSASRSRDRARSRLRSAESEGSQLRSRISTLNSRISSLESQLSSCRSSL